MATRPHQDNPTLPSKTESRPRRKTLNDVASAVGVSAITISRALHRPELVQAELRTRILAAVAALGYVPDPAARALASRRSSTVVALVPSLANAVFVDLLESVQSVCDAAGLQLLIGNTHYRAADEERLLRSHLAATPSGVLLAGFERTTAAERLLAEAAVPTVYMMDLAPAPGIHSVGFDQRAAAQALMAALTARGRRRIGFAGAQLDRRTIERAEGWRAAAITAGSWSPVREILSPEPSSPALGAQLLDRLLAAAPDTDAIFFGNDDLAAGALARARELGIAVPAQLAIAGFNDLPFAAWLSPSLTTVKTPRAEVGRRAAERLVALIRGEPIAAEPENLGFELMLRESA
ncbi:MAG: LacI family DNA-binding transcriptional regulator [Burkholderiaceae bacterium]